MNKSTDLSLLMLSNTCTDTLRGHGITTAEELSDLLHSSLTSTTALQQLLKFDEAALEALRATVDRHVKPVLTPNKIGKLGAISNRPKPKGNP